VSVQLSRLASGLTVVSHSMLEVETVSLGIWVGTGSRCEREGEHGISHLLEHMAFKGTATRTPQQIAEEIEEVGGDINAATGVDATAYYVKLLGTDLPLALDLLSDILANPLFDEVELAREKDVVLQEIASALDSPEDVVFDLAQAAAYPGQALGRPILGTIESVPQFTPSHLHNYLGTHYGAPNLVLSAAGAVNHDALVREAERRLAHFAPAKPPVFEPAHYQGGWLRSELSFEQTHIVLAFEAPPYGHADYFASHVLAGVLGGGMSSRLFQEARERRGLCYSISSFASGLSDSGMFTIHAATTPDRVADLFGVIRNELENAAEQGVQEKELARVKAQLKMGLLANLESSSARAEQLARHVLVYGRPLATKELLEKVEKVTVADLQRLAQSQLQSKPPSLATVGAILNVASFDAVADKFAFASSQAA
jgi:predicted Zn-dependent peptidase